MPPHFTRFDRLIAEPVCFADDYPARATIASQEFKSLIFENETGKGPVRVAKSYEQIASSKQDEPTRQAISLMDRLRVRSLL